MKDTFKKTGTRAFGLCVIALTALFAFTLTACDNDPDPGPSTSRETLAGTVTITGVVKVGNKVEADVSKLNATHGFKYEWEYAVSSQPDFFMPIDDATDKEYTIDVDEGVYLRVTVTASGFRGSVSSASYEVHDENYVPTISGTVTISGIVKVGAKVTADVSNVDPQTGLSYQWEYAEEQDSDDFTAIDDATSNEYTIAEEYEGYFLRVTVKAEGYEGSVSSTSHEVQPEDYVAPELSGTVTITGLVKVGSEVEASVSGSNAEEGFSYQWEVSDTETGDFAAIENQTNQKYTVNVAADKYIRVTVSATGFTGTISSDASKVAAADAQGPDIATITIGGYEGDTPTVNKGWTLTLTATVKDSEGNEVASENRGVTWSVNSTISSINGGVLTVPMTETAETLTVTATSSIVTSINGTLQVTVSSLLLKDFGDVSIVDTEGKVVGLYKVGDEVKVDTSKMDVEGDFGYQWQYSDTQWIDRYDATKATDIAGETNDTYTVTEAVKGKFIRVIITLDKYEGVNGSFTSKVRAGEPSVTSVAINNKGTGTITMQKGTSRSFSSTVLGTNLEEIVDTGVTWSMTGKQSANTSINAGGFLVVATDEIANTLQVTVTSVLDNTKKDTVTIQLIFEGNTLTISGLSGQSGSVSVEVKETADHFATGGANVSFGTGIISGDEVKIDLFYARQTSPYGNAPWTETEGNYYILIKGPFTYGFVDTYMYTGGDNLVTDGTVAGLLDNPKFEFEFTDKSATIAFDQFKLVQNGQGGYALTITGLTAYEGSVVNVEVATRSTGGIFQSTTIHARGRAIISGGTATIILAKISGGAETLEGWVTTALTGTLNNAAAICELSITNATSNKTPWYWYTAGAALPGTITTFNGYLQDTSVRYTFDVTNQASTIDLDQFLEIPTALRP